MEKFLYASNPVRRNLTGPSECGKFCFVTELFWKTINDLEKYVSTDQLYIKI